MKPLKALGVDGLYKVFYQSQRSVVGPSVCCFIKNIFVNKHIPMEINKNLLVLILKADNPLNLKMYWPISLCTVVYKTMTKLPTNRLQTILPYVIGPHQTSFVTRWHTIENIVVAHAVVHSMLGKSGRRGVMAIKVDLENAYDRLSWSFIFWYFTRDGHPDGYHSYYYGMYYHGNDKCSLEWWAYEGFCTLQGRWTRGSYLPLYLCVVYWKAEPWHF